MVVEGVYLCVCVCVCMCKVCVSFGLRGCGCCHADEVEYARRVGEVAYAR